MLRKLKLALILILFISKAAFSQVEIGAAYGAFNTAVTASNFENVPNSTQPKFEGRLGSRIAASVFFKLKGNLSLRAEPALISSTFKETLDSFFINQTVAPGYRDDYNIQSEYQIQHLRLPLLLNYSFHLVNFRKLNEDGLKPKSLSLDVFAGPYFSYLIYSQRKSLIDQKRSSALDTSSRYNFSKTEEKSGALPSDQINNWDFGAIAGIALKASITNRVKIFIEARQNFSSYNLNKGLWDRVTNKPNNPLENQTVTPKIRLASSVMFSAGFIFSIYRKK